jgi:hypothetical protein
MRFHRFCKSYGEQKPTPCDVGFCFLKIEKKRLLILHLKDDLSTGMPGLAQGMGLADFSQG